MAVCGVCFFFFFGRFGQLVIYRSKVDGKFDTTQSGDSGGRSPNSCKVNSVGGGGGELDVYSSSPVIAQARARHRLDWGRMETCDIHLIPPLLLSLCLVYNRLSKMLNRQTVSTGLITTQWIIFSFAARGRKRKSVGLFPTFLSLLYLPHPSPPCYVPGMTGDM